MVDSISFLQQKARIEQSVTQVKEFLGKTTCN